MHWITCVARIPMGYIKSNVTLNYFMDPQLWESGEISFFQITSCDNHVDLFTKSLSLTIFDKCVKDIGMRRLKYLQNWEGEPLLMIPLRYITLYSFPFMIISHERFLTR
jgi:hypothetical protein